MNEISKDQRPKAKDLSSVAAILLAAGRSQRMGRFKPLLPFGNTTVIQSCINYLRGGGVDEIIVVAGHRSDEIIAAVRNESVTVVENPDPSSEMSDSIACGVSALPNTGAVVIAPVDHPAIPSDVVRTIIREWEKGASLIVPTCAGLGGHPVLVDLQFRRELHELPADLGLKALFRRHNEAVLRLPVDSPFIARDIDTWDDYTQLYRDVFARDPPRWEESNESSLRAI